MHGQGAKVVGILQGREVLFLTDYVNQRGMVESGVRPFPEGASAYEMLQRALTGDLKALLVFADDLFEFFPSLASEAFKRLEFAVVVDSVKTQATKYAHVVLPGALLAEKYGTLTNCEGRTQTLEPVNPPLSGLTERHILEQLLLLLGETPEAGETPPLSVNSPAIEPDSPTGERPFIVALDSGTFWNNHALAKASVTIWREVRRPFVDFPNGYVLVSFFEISVFGAGEVPISISSPPSLKDQIILSVRAAGYVTSLLHQLKPGDVICLRGPLGNGFPMEEFYERYPVRHHNQSPALRHFEDHEPVCTQRLLSDRCPFVRRSPFVQRVHQQIDSYFGAHSSPGMGERSNRRWG